MKRILAGVAVGLFGAVILGGTANAAVAPVKVDRKTIVIDRKTVAPLEKERAFTDEKER